MRLASTSGRFGQIIEGRGAGHLVVEAARHVAHAPRLAHAGAVQAERVEAAAGEFEAAEEDAHLLGVVHAVEHDHGRRGAGASAPSSTARAGWCPRRAPRRTRRSDGAAGCPGARPCRRGRIARVFSGLGRDEALGVVVIDAGAEVIVAGGDLAALGQRLVAALLDLIAERAPFLEPGLAAIRLRPRARAAFRRRDPSPPATRRHRAPCP